MMSGNSSEWFLDSAYGNHMALNPILKAAHTPTIHPTIYTASGSLTIVSQVASIFAPNLSVSSVYQILNLAHNLLYVGQMTELGLILLFSSNAIIVQDPWMGQIVRTACKVRWLFELHSLHLSSPGLLASIVFPSTSSSLELWHSCLGHSSTSLVQLLVYMGILSTTSNSLFDRMACQLGKQLAFPFNKSDSYALTPFDIVHSNVWGPFLIPIMGSS